MPSKNSPSAALPPPPGIPVVDLAPIQGPYASVSSSAYEAVVTQLGDAMSSIGFAYIINHGIAPEKIQKVYSVSREFFHLPAPAKQKYSKTNPPENFHGYTQPGAELLNEAAKNSTELREIWDCWGWWGPGKAYPQEIPGFQAAFEAIRPEMDNVSKKLFRLMAQYLNLEDDEFFVRRHKNLGDLSIPCQTQMRSMYYYKLDPEMNIPPNAIRCGEHSDWGSITLLFQDEVGGLEVQNVVGEWIQATPIPGAIILNSGQLMELWSGGTFHAALHRVRIPEVKDVSQKPRQSFIYFVNPDGSVPVSPIPGLSIRPGKEELASKPTLIAYAHYKERIVEATKNGY